jgi:hypothetical protein
MAGPWKLEPQTSTVSKTRSETHTHAKQSTKLHRRARLSCEFQLSLLHRAARKSWCWHVPWTGGLWHKVRHNLSLIMLSRTHEAYLNGHQHSTRKRCRPSARRPYRYLRCRSQGRGDGASTLPARIPAPWSSEDNRTVGNSLGGDTGLIGHWVPATARGSPSTKLGTGTEN